MSGMVHEMCATHGGQLRVPTLQVLHYNHGVLNHCTMVSDDWQALRRHPLLRQRSSRAETQFNNGFWVGTRFFAKEHAPEYVPKGCRADGRRRQHGFVRLSQ